MRKTFPTIHDVAGHLGLSISTVSFVINGRADQQRISSQTVQRVNNYIQEIGYVPDRCAQSFRTKRTGIIGLLVNDVSEISTISLVKQLEQIAFAAGFKLIIQQLDEEKKIRNILHTLQDNQIEGYLLMLSNKIPDEYLKRIERYQLPIIFFSLDTAKNSYPYVDQFVFSEVNTEMVSALFTRLKDRLTK